MENNKEKINEENSKRTDDKFIKDYLLVEKAMQKCYRYLCKLYKVKHLKYFYFVIYYL